MLIYNVIINVYNFIYNLPSLWHLIIAAEDRIKHTVKNVSFRKSQKANQSLFPTG